MIGEFIEISDLHYDTDKLKEIIVKFDDTKNLFVKEMMVPTNSIEMQQFWTKILYRIRYIFSKLGRLINLHENEEINKWLTKENARIIKKISKNNPNLADKLKHKKIPFINIDLDKCKGANFAILCHYKEALQKWRNEIDYALLQRK